jgi:hypothetical protein
VNWGKRIRKLELHFHGDDDDQLAFEDWQLIWSMAGVEPAKYQASTHRIQRVQRIVQSDAFRDWLRQYAARSCSEETSAAIDSPIPSETCGTSTCFSPVLTGTTTDETTTATPSNNGEPVAIIQTAGSAGRKARSQASEKKHRPKTARKTAAARRGRKP